MKLGEITFSHRLFMSKISDRAKLEFIINLIDDIEFIINRHESISNTLNDIEGKHAVLMCLQQIGESLGKLEDTKMKSQLEGKEANLMRNIIAHDYMGIKVSIVVGPLEISIPKLKSNIHLILKKESEKQE